MSLNVASTTDSVEEINDALKHSGYTPNEVEEFSSEKKDESDETPPVAEDPSAPKVEGEKPKTEGKTAEVPDASDTQEKPKEGKGFQKRIDDLTRDKYAEREQRIAAEERAKQLERTLAEKNKPAEEPKSETKPAEAAGKPQPPVAPKRPKQSEFDTFELFEEAQATYDTARDAFDSSLIEYHSKLADWTAAQKLEEFKQQKAVEAQQAEAEERKAAWDAKVDAAVASGVYEDFEEVTKAIAAGGDGDVMISAAMMDAATELDLGPYIFYWLAKNPEEAERITKLTTYDPKKTPVLKVLAINRLAGREIAMIEAEIAADLERVTAEKGGETKVAAPVTPKPRASSAPPPIKPVGTRAGTAVDTAEKVIDGKNYTFADYNRDRARRAH